MHIYDYMVCEKATIKNAAATMFNLTTRDRLFLTLLFTQLIPIAEVLHACV